MTPVQFLIVEVLALTGWKPKEIAAFLGMNPKTVRGHIIAACRRLDVRGQTGLIVWAYQSGLIKVRR